MVSVFNQTKILFIILSLIFVSSAATLSVNGTGANCLVGTQVNYSTIQAAVNAASAGDTVYVCRNSTTGYRENVGINKSINLYGNESGVLVVTPVNLPPFSVNATYVNITNFTLTGTFSTDGLRLNSTANYTYVYKVTANGSIYGFYVSSNYNRLNNNTAHNNSQTGFYVFSGDYNNLTNSTSYNNTNGLEAQQWSNNTILASNTAYNNSGYGFRMQSSYNSTVINNIAYNNSDNGFRLSPVYNTNISNNTAYNNTNYGIEVTSSSANNTVFSNTAYKNANSGVAINGESNSTIKHNIAYNNSLYGILFVGGSNITVDNNTAYDNTIYGFVSSVTPSNYTISNNSAYNNSQVGFVFDGVNNFNVTSNNASNNTLAQYHFQAYSNVTFTGTNRAVLTPQNALDFNITNGSNVTTLVGSTYNNFTTSYGTIFFYNAVNITVKLMNLSDSGVSSTGCSGFSGTCTLLTPNTNVVNISNASATGTIVLGMFYNTSTSPTSSNLYIGKYVTANSGWQQIGQTSVDTANGTVKYGAITSFSAFGIVNFVASSSPPSSDGTTVKSLEIDYDFTCSNGSLEVSTTKGAEVSLVELAPTYLLLEKKEADSEGNALFTITEDGTYKIRATKSGYTSAEEENLEFNLCEEETPEPELECTTNNDCSLTEQCLNNECVLVTGECGYASNHEFVSYECCSDSDCEEGYECTDNNCVLKFTPEPPTPDDSQTEALDSINKAQNTLNEAKKQGKDITAAQKKLNEAKEAYENGEYEKVKQLLTGVENLIKEPEEKPEPVPQPPEERPTDLTGLLLMVGSAIVVVVVLVGAYFFLKGGKSKDYKFKK